MRSNIGTNDSIFNAEVIRTDAKQASPWKTLFYTREGSDATEKREVPRSACVMKGNILEFVDETVYVQCKNGNKKAKIFPYYSVSDNIQLGNLTIPVVVKEITKPEEYQVYHHLQFHHYRGKSLFGRHAPLVMCAFHPFLPSVVGYIELVTPFGVSKPRREFFNAQCKLDGISWEQWNNETVKETYLAVCPYCPLRSPSRTPGDGCWAAARQPCDSIRKRLLAERRNETLYT